MSDESKVRSSRIVYVEPNDVYRASTTFSDGTEIEKTLTPPLEDMCVSFNLSVFPFSRTKPKISASTDLIDKDNVRQFFNLEWRTKEVNGEIKDDKGKPFSFLAGSNFGDDKNPKEYLTTYYTDISYENYGTNKIVEGLGVESIQIGFESWYTPTVTIKFIDVRGSAIFGNEEAIHDKHDNLTAENIFGCFMTIPYPLFRLQIKGFLGKPVTYQLTCSDCKFDYNPRTGNVEVTAQFIGYTYSLLTDIPIKYIVAAPYMTYVGKDYWDAHISSPDWALDDGSQPRTLSEIFNEIKAALNLETKPSDEVSDEANQVARYNTEKTALNDLLKTHQAFVTAFLKLFSGYYDNTNAEGYRQIVCFRKNELKEGVDDKTFDKMKEAYDAFKIQHDDYNTDYSSTALSDDLLPDIGLGKGRCDYPTANDQHKAFLIEYKDGQVRTNVKFIKLTDNGKQVNVQNIQNHVWNNAGQKLIKENAQRLLKSGLTSPFDSTVEEYCYILDLNTYAAKIKSRIEELNIKIKNTQRSIDNQTEANFLSKLRFRPNIGNIFKIVMCHLETFTHVMYHAASDIIAQGDRGERGFDKLGLRGAEDTDYKDGVTKVGPWPGVYKSSTSNNNTVTSTDSDRTLAWVGDFSDNFIESEVVEGIFGAVLRLMEDKFGNKNNQPNSNIFPLLPTDIEMSSPFVDVRTGNTIDNLAAQLAQRGSTLFGLLNGSNISEEMAAMMGRVDAYNYFLAFGSAVAIEQDILNRVGQNNLADVLVGIAMCDSTYDSYGSLNQNTGETRFCFETDKPVAYGGMGREGRHPLLKAEGNNFKYVYYGLKQRDGNETIGAIPSYVRSNYRTDRSIAFNEDHHIVVYKEQSHTIEPKSLVHAGNSKKILRTKSELTKPDDYFEKYVNHGMFNIITNEDKIKRLDAINTSARSGSLQIGTYEVTEDLSSLADRFWKVRDKDVAHFFAKNGGWGYYYLSETIPNRFTAKEKVPEYNPAYPTRATLNDDGKWVVDGSEKQVAVPATVVVSPTSNSLIMSLFTNSFYYLQNNITDGAIRKKVKTLLFLHAQWWSKDVMECFKSSNGCMEAVPYGYLLLLGGLLWRKKQANDPIIYSSNGAEWKVNSKDKTFFYNFNNTEIVPKFLLKNSPNNYHVTVLSLFGGEYYPDINIQNQLIRLFEEFVDDNFTVITGYELRHSHNGQNKSCSASEINTDIAEYRKYRDEVRTLDTYKDKSVNDGAEYIKLHLNGNLSEIWSKYGYSGYSPRVGSAAPPANDRPVVLYYKADDTVIQGLYNKLMSKCVVTNITHQPLFENGVGKDITFSASIYRRYVSSFVETLKKTVENNQNSILRSNGKSSQGEGKDLREFRMSIYYYCKALWENWLVNSNENSFNVNPFFKDNFIFIDSFYRNIYSQLPMNCEHLVSIYDGSSDTTSLFSYLSNLISKQRCIFFAVPDYIGFQGDSADYDRMSDVFRPIPYQEMNKELETSNKFVIIYTHKPSEHLKNDASEFRWDGFDIWAADGKSGEVENNPPMIFKASTLSPNPSGDYHVPSFGVSVNRQNNTIFKNISLTNRNPVQTEAAIMALSNIIDKAKNRDGAVTFHGQDMYNVFSNYSYQTEIEMMGDAQIQPLMYFQLLNVPMWRGTYMIFNVQHSMTPGNMTTKFKGMKLCATPIPFATSYLSFFTPGDGDGYGISQGNGGYASDGLYLQPEYQKLTAAQDYYRQSENRDSNVVDEVKRNNGEIVKTNPVLIQLFNDLYEEIKALDEGWNIYVTNATVSDYDNPKSQHFKGDAIDIQIKKGNTVINKGSEKPSPELIKVIDIIYSINKHRNVCGQVLLEYRIGEIDNFRQKGDKQHFYNVLHIAVNNNHTSKGTTLSHIEVKICDAKGKNAPTGSDFLTHVPLSFVSIASRAYRSTGGMPMVNKHFYNFGQCADSESVKVLDKVSTGYGAAFDRWWSWSKSWEGKKADLSEIYGWTQTAEESYVKDGGNKNDSPNLKAYNYFWKRNKLDQIQDGNLAIMCMYILYWNGNSSCIHFALDGERNKDAETYSHCIGVGGNAPHGALDSETLKRINEYPNPKQLASRIKYHAGRLITTAKTKSGADYCVKYPGHLRRWESIGYTYLKMNSEMTTQPTRAEVETKLAGLWQ